MTVLTRELKHRLIGMLVLFALVIIFVPIIFDRPNELRPVEIKVPQAPKPLPLKAKPATKASVPELAPVKLEEEIADKNLATTPQSKQESTSKDQVLTPSKAEESKVTAQPKVAPNKQQQELKPVTTNKPSATKETKKPRLDANGLPITWSVQVVSLAKREAALNLQTSLRKQGYNAYIREVNNMHRVFVGPVIERSDAQKILDKIAQDHKLKGFVVRFTP